MEALLAEERSNELWRQQTLARSAEQRLRDGYQPIPRDYAEEILRADGDIDVDVMGHEIEFPLYTTKLMFGTKITGISSRVDDQGVRQPTIAVARVKSETLTARITNAGLVPEQQLSMYANVTHFTPSSPRELHAIVQSYLAGKEHVWRDSNPHPEKQARVRDLCELEHSWIDLTYET